MLRDQVILVTGCSTGIGRALALELGARGQPVVATARRLEALADVSQSVDVMPLDVTDERSIASCVGATLERYRRIDVLVNNAGVNLFGALAEMPLSGVRGLWEVNVTGALAMVQAVFPQMAERGSGRIVNIGSIVADLPTPFAGPYAASKAALHALSEVLRMEVAPFGVDVIEVQPGGVRSQIAESGSVDLDRYRQQTSRYHAARAGIEKRALASQRRAMEADEFARRIANEMLADRPRRVIREGGGVAVFAALTRLPRAVRDPLVARYFGLRGLWRGERER